MVEPGTKVIYRCLAGWKCDAVVTRCCPEPPKHPGSTLAFGGSFDIEVDAGSKNPVTLTRIELVEPEALVPGTCTCILA